MYKLPKDLAKTAWKKGDKRNQIIPMKILYN